MTWFFVLVGVCTMVHLFFKIIDRIERPKRRRFS